MDKDCWRQHSRHTPSYVPESTVWVRTDDKKIFEPNISRKLWVAEDGEVVPFLPKSKILRGSMQKGYKKEDD